MMVAFIDQRRAAYGVEPICAQLPDDNFRVYGASKVGRQLGRDGIAESVIGLFKSEVVLHLVPGVSSTMSSAPLRGRPGEQGRPRSGRGDGQFVTGGLSS